MKGTMNSEQLRLMKARISDRKEKVERVLREYCSIDGCPCGFDRFVYWAGKYHGPGWQDSIQNQLVLSAVELDCYTGVEEFTKEYWLSGEYRCGNCGTGWRHFSEEWRMLAFRERLLKVGGADPSGMYDGVIGDDIFATAGREPSGTRSISLDEWVEFMLDTGSSDTLS